jgi:hypothetical protein
LFGGQQAIIIVFCARGSGDEQFELDCGVGRVVKVDEQWLHGSQGRGYTGNCKMGRVALSMRRERIAMVFAQMQIHR